MDVMARIPKCAKCRNHGITAPLKSHKRECLFNNCTCDKCSLVFERKRINTAQSIINKNDKLKDNFKNIGQNQRNSSKISFSTQFHPNLGINPLLCKFFIISVSIKILERNHCISYLNYL